MLSNIDKSKGIVYSQRILVDLMDKGLTREKAYDLVQRIALAARDKKIDFQKAVLDDKEMSKYFSKQKIKEFFEPNYYIKNVDVIYKRFNLPLRKNK